MFLNFILLLFHLCHCVDIKYSHINKENNLYFIFTTFRHGARKPLSKIDFFGNHNYTSGALTEYGKIQHLEIGKKYRKRYSNFINLKFDKNEIYIRSSNIMRTIVSTEKELEGFFNKTIDRSNIFIMNHGYSMNLYHLNKKDHKEMEQYFEICSKRKLAKNYINIYKSEIFPNIKHCHLMENISDSGINRFCDSMISHYFEYTYGNETNNIISRCSNENIKKFYDFCVEYYDSLRGFSEHGAYVFYNFFHHIFECMYNSIRGKSKIKMIMIGGHDTTVGQFMNFLDGLKIIPRTFYPHYACNIVIELRKYNSEFYLEFYYNDVLKYNNTLEKFKKILDNSVYSNLYNYCRNQSRNSFLNKKINDKTKIKSNYTLKSIESENSQIFGKNQNKNKSKKAKNEKNILDNKYSIIKSFSLNSTNSNVIKTKNETILINYEKNLIKKLLNFPFQKGINYYFIIIIAFMLIVFIKKFS